MEHFCRPRNQGGLDDYDREGFACVRPHGPFVRIQLRLVDGIIAQAGFQTFGCGVAIGCCSFLTEAVQGRQPKECSEITAEELESALGGLPPARRFCGQLAIEALRQALKDT
jgi:NifU-like protein involved in Fe-S cluster formation